MPRSQRCLKLFGAQTSFHDYVETLSCPTHDPAYRLLASEPPQGFLKMPSIIITDSYRTQALRVRPCQISWRFLPF
jgi:hypothetical protein